MKTKTQRFVTGRRLAAVGLALFMVCATVTTPMTAQAQSQYRLNSSQSDIMGSHNERMLVVFNGSAHFMRYFLIDMMRETVTVAKDTQGVQYDLHDNAGDKVLVIH